MYCTGCGQQIGEETKYCPQCGKPARQEVAPAAPPERLFRVRAGKKIAGVCAGFARYLGMDVTLVRIVWMVTALTAGVGFIAYLVAWIAMPYGPEPVYLPPDGDRHPVANG